MKTTSGRCPWKCWKDNIPCGIWWTLISDLRTVLEKHPRAVDEIKALLAQVA
jgi:hypothetical protein